jgi:hypothetical protein
MRISDYNQDMDKTGHIYTSLKEMKADEYRYWQGRPAHERLRATSEMTLSAYKMKESAPNVRRLQRTLVSLQRPQG